MTRTLVLGNGNIFVGLDRFGYVREFYFPFVGLENHVSSHNQHRIGVWVDGTFSWLHEEGWETRIDCLDDTMAGVMIKSNARLDLSLHFTDVVYNEKNIFLRKVHITQQQSGAREVRLFFGQEFELYESHRGDTAYYDPSTNSVIHYKGRRVFLVNAESNNVPFTEYTTGIFNIYGKEGSFRDAEDGELQKNPIEHGPCDSVIGIKAVIQGKQATTVTYWLCVAESIQEAKALNGYVLKKSPEHIIKSTQDYWRAWANRYKFDFQDLSDLHVKLFKKSLFYIRAHVDKGGAIIASGDTSMLQNGKDTYSYMWPRDAAFAALALDQTGDQAASQRFFEFCNQVMSPEGYFMHKYLSDHSLGSSWHPWIRNGKAILPIQEDETAIILVSLKKHYETNRDLEFVEGLYNTLIKPAARFLANFRDAATGLPRPSYDLWEEKYGTHTFTAASVYGALQAASFFADILGKKDDSNIFSLAAEEIKTSIMTHLYDDQAMLFRKSITILPSGEIKNDDTIDASSAYGVFMFRVLDANDSRLEKAMATAEKTLTNSGKTGGIIRYTGDRYFMRHEGKSNPWIITSLWFAQYHIQKASSFAELAQAKKYLTWTVNHAGESGVLSEQLDPTTGDMLSSTPLTWSHVEYVRTVLDYIQTHKRLKEK